MTFHMLTWAGNVKDIFPGSAVYSLYKNTGASILGHIFIHFKFG